MYSVVKHQDLSTTVENKTFSQKGFILLTVISVPQNIAANYDVNPKIEVAGFLLLQSQIQN